MNTVVRTSGATVGLYSPAVIPSPASTFVFVSGVLSVDLHGATVGAGDFELQMSTVFQRLGEVLDAAGSSFQQICKMTTYVTDSRLVGEFYRLRVPIFERLYPQGNFPGNTLLVVSGLVRPEFLLEIEAIATTGTAPAPSADRVG